MKHLDTWSADGALPGGPDGRRRNNAVHLCRHQVDRAAVPLPPTYSAMRLSAIDSDSAFNSLAGVTVTVESVLAERHAGATLVRPALPAVAHRSAAGPAALVPAPLTRLAQRCRTGPKPSVRGAVTAMSDSMPGTSRPVPSGLRRRALPETTRVPVTRGPMEARAITDTAGPRYQPPPPGSTTVALNPPPARFSSRISPPWPRMMVRAMARPRPAPPVSRLRDSSSRTKGSNTRSRSAPGCRALRPR